jgi:hypothetical protein
LAGHWVVYIVCLPVWENAGMSEKLYSLVMEQGKKEEIHKLKYTV